MKFFHFPFFLFVNSTNLVFLLEKFIAFLLIDFSLRFFSVAVISVLVALILYPVCFAAELNLGELLQQQKKNVFPISFLEFISFFFGAQFSRRFRIAKYISLKRKKGWNSE